MALRITYWTASKTNNNLPGAVISAESLTISGTTAQSGATPANAVYVSIRSTETGEASFDYGSANPTATNDGLDGGIGPGERLWLDAVSGNKVAGITG